MDISKNKTSIQEQENRNTVGNLTFVIIILGLLVGYFSSTGTKSQIVRIIDVVIIGPLMIYLGHHLFKTNFSSIEMKLNLHSWLAIILILIGATTISYNLRNYLFITGVKF